MSFSDLGLFKELVNTLTEKGYTIPTPIQAQGIPLILQGKDLMATSQTGTGKTAGFTLPLLQKLLEKPLKGGGKRQVRALILAPTRELVLQITESVRTYGKGSHLKISSIYGGVNMHAQKRELAAGVDIIVATPGRLLDHVRQKTVHLSHIEMLVLDEADRMLDMGFIHDIKQILLQLPKERQTLLFSATFSKEIRALSSQFLVNPAVLEIAQENAPADLITHSVYPVDQNQKKALLLHLISSNEWKQVLVFTRTKHGANKLAEHLATGGISSTAIHGNKSQAARFRALSEFKKGKISVLVATDIAARGIDIQELPHVINFELPYVPEDYVHRIGRTGRAGKKGEAISLVSREERSLLRDIERLLKQPITSTIVPGYEPQAKSPSAPTRPKSALRPRPNFHKKRFGKR